MIYLIGAGPGNPKLLTIESRELIENATNIIAFGRIGESLKGLNKNIISINKVDRVEELVKESLLKERDLAILASGDPGYFGILNFIKRITKKEEVKVYPAISSMQYLMGKLSLPWSDACNISLHGRPLCRLNKITEGEASIYSILTDGTNSPIEVINYLRGKEVKGRLIIGYDLSSERECILDFNDMADIPFEDLNYIRKNKAISLVIFIKEGQGDKDEDDFVRDTNNSFLDEDFIRTRVPMTKFEIRSLIMDYLRVNRGDRVLEIGSGTGSVTCEFLRRGALVTSIECDDEAYDLTLKNIENLKLKRSISGIANIQLIHGKAPEAIPSSESYDLIYIGGSSGNLEGIIEKVKPLIKVKGKILGTFVTIDNAYRLKKALKEASYKVNLSLITVAKEDDYGILRGRNPIYIILGEGYEE